MANLQQAMDGRQALAWLLEPETGTSISTDLAVGDIVFVTGKAASGSNFGDVEVGKPFIADKAVTTLPSGDTYVKMKPYFMGFATDKSINLSKNTTQITTDYDEADNYVSDGIVAVSGSIQGSFMIEGAKYSTTMLKQRFIDIIQIADGAPTVHKAKTTEKDILMIIWNARDAKVGDELEILVQPAFFNSLALGGAYGSPNSFNLDFTGNATDENNFGGATIHVKNVAGLLPAFTRSGADEQAKA